MENSMQPNFTYPKPELIDAFHIMYDYFPEAVMLIHKSKKIVAVNPAATAQGREPGKLCALHGTPDLHMGCLSHETMNEQKAQCKAINYDGRDLVLYWLPVNDYPDYYVHFALNN